MIVNYPDERFAIQHRHAAGRRLRYAGFEKLYGPARTKPGPITEVACWVHTRRGCFDEWEHHKSPTAKQALDRIATIYAVEAALRVPHSVAREPRASLVGFRTPTMCPWMAPGRSPQRIPPAAATFSDFEVWVRLQVL